MTTTPNEIKALKAIVDSEYQSSDNPVGHDVWTLYVNPFPNKITQAGVYASLVKKGYINTIPASRGEMGTVHITQAGYDALTVALSKMPVVNQTMLATKHEVCECGHCRCGHGAGYLSCMGCNCVRYSWPGMNAEITKPHDQSKKFTYVRGKGVKS